MKATLLLFYASLFSVIGYTQTDTISSNIYQLDGNLGLGISDPSHLLTVKGLVDYNKKEEFAKFSLQNDSESYLVFGNSTYDNSYFVPEIKGLSVKYDMPGLVLRGMTTPNNDNSNGALIHITPYILSGENVYYPNNRHYLGIQGYETGIGEKPLLEIDEQGNIGVGTNLPAAKLHIADGDIYIQDINKGIIMKSPDGNCWRGVLDNSGNLTFAQIECPDLYNQSTKDLMNVNEENIYPNPANNMVSILFNNNNFEGYSYSICDINGIIKAKGDINSRETEIDVSTFPSGIYFVQIRNEDRHILSTKKLMVE